MKQKKPGPSKPLKNRRPDLRGKHRRPEVIYEFNEADNRLYDLFKNHGFGDFPHEKRHQLVKFYQLLMQHQLTDNVTRLLKFHEIAIKHFIDSLMPSRLTELTFPLLDVGTGPGFPGIPLKIVYPEKKFLLAEGVRKRVDFLKAVRDEMGLENLDIFGRNIEPEFQYPVQGVITRAVEEVSKTLWNVSQSIAIGGRVFLMKGPGVDKEIAAAKAEFGQFYKLVDDIHYELPNTPHKRRLVIYEKIATPDLNS